MVKWFLERIIRAEQRQAQHKPETPDWAIINAERITLLRSLSEYRKFRQERNKKDQHDPKQRTIPE